MVSEEEILTVCNRCVEEISVPARFEGCLVLCDDCIEDWIDSWDGD
jgi:hypothetical protein